MLWEAPNLSPTSFPWFSFTLLNKTHKIFYWHDKIIPEHAPKYKGYKGMSCSGFFQILTYCCWDTTIWGFKLHQTLHFSGVTVNNYTVLQLCNHTRLIIRASTHLAKIHCSLYTKPQCLITREDTKYMQIFPHISTSLEQTVRKKLNIGCLPLF